MSLHEANRATASIATAKLVRAERQLTFKLPLVAPKPELATGAGVNMPVRELLVEVIVFMVDASWDVVIGEEVELENDAELDAVLPDDDASLCEAGVELPAPATVLSLEEGFDVAEFAPADVVAADVSVDIPLAPEDVPVDAPPTTTPSPVVVVDTDVEVTRVVDVESGAVVEPPMDGAVRKMVELGL
jgi:hypothetical protein